MVKSTDDVGLIRTNMLKTLKNDQAAPAARVAAAQVLMKLGRGDTGSALGSMSREAIQDELAECARKLGRKPL